MREREKERVGTGEDVTEITLTPGVIETKCFVGESFFFFHLIISPFLTFYWEITYNSRISEIDRCADNVFRSISYAIYFFFFTNAFIRRY